MRKCMPLYGSTVNKIASAEHKIKDVYLFVCNKMKPKKFA
jgi:hypothetical protein